MPLFGTKTWIKLGGYAKVDAIMDSTKVGNPNKFATGSIPVTGDPTFDSDQEFNLHAKQTRLSFELRSPTQLGSLRIYYENDFYGGGSATDMEYNLRHFYGQVANLTVGQTWTAFFDPDALPDTLDFAGPGVQAVVRQPQVRYTFTLPREGMHAALERWSSPRATWSHCRPAPPRRARSSPHSRRRRLRSWWEHPEIPASVSAR